MAIIRRNEEERDALIVEHFALVRWEVDRIQTEARNPGKYDDYISEGTYALLLAAEQWDVAREVPFPPYARLCIRYALCDYMRKESHIPYTLIYKMKRVPKDSEEYKALREKADRYHTYSIDDYNRSHERVDGTVDGVASESGTPGWLARSEGSDYLRHALSLLNSRQRYILEQTVLHERTCRSVAEEYHLSEARISQIRLEALQILREYNEEEGLSHYKR